MEPNFHYRVHKSLSSARSNHSTPLSRISINNYLHILIQRRLLGKNWPFFLLLIHRKNCQINISFLYMTHVTACQDNNSSECLSLQIITHVTAITYVIVVTTHVSACHENDSRDCLPRQWFTWLTTDHDTRDCLSRQRVTWLLAMMSWLTWLFFMTMTHVTREFRYKDHRITSFNLDRPSTVTLVAFCLLSIFACLINVCTGMTFRYSWHTRVAVKVLTHWLWSYCK